MISKFLTALAVFILVMLGCLLLGTILVGLEKVEMLVDIGNFFKQWSVLIGAAAGLLSFGSGTNWFGRFGRP